MEDTVTIDTAGRLVVPKALRDQLALRPGARLRVRADGDRLVLELIQETPRVREEDGLLVIEGRADAWPDHRDDRDERIAKLTAG